MILYTRRHSSIAYEKRFRAEFGDVIFDKFKLNILLIQSRDEKINRNIVREFFVINLNAKRVYETNRNSYITLRATSTKLKNKFINLKSKKQQKTQKAYFAPRVLCG